jgi:hypothetical protein
MKRKLDNEKKIRSYSGGSASDNEEDIIDYHITKKRVSAIKKAIITSIPPPQSSIKKIDRNNVPSYIN